MSTTEVGKRGSRGRPATREVASGEVSLYDDACSADAAIAAIDEAAAMKQFKTRALIKDLEEHLGPLHDWPHAEQRLLLGASPPGRSALYRFVLFALGNRAPPSPLARLLDGGQLLKDAKARRDAWDAFAAFRDRKLRPDAFFWCIATQQRTLVHACPPPPRDAVFWADAQALLARKYT